MISAMSTKHTNKTKIKAAMVLFLAVIFAIAVDNVIFSGLETSASRAEESLGKDTIADIDNDYFRLLSEGPNGNGWGQRQTQRSQPLPEALQNALQRRQQEEIQLQRQRQQQHDSNDGNHSNDNEENKDSTMHQNVADKRSLKGAYEYEFYGPFPSNIPYKDRWHHRFQRAYERNRVGGMLFFRHVRKAGGTALGKYFQQVVNYHENTASSSSILSSISQPKPKILYVKEEFHPLSHDCSTNDPRWLDSLSITVLRHPIDRHLSEFFYHGPGRQISIDRTRLYVDERYTSSLSKTLQELIPKWMKTTDNAEEDPYNPRMTIWDNFRRYFFFRHYTDNFQLRAFAGCSFRECISTSSMKHSISEEELKFIEEITVGKIIDYRSPNWDCAGGEERDEFCNANDRDANAARTCPYGCEGPCRYPSVSFGELGEGDLERGKKALEAFDVVLIMETFDEEDQRAFLADVLSVPREGEVDGNGEELGIRERNSNWSHLHGGAGDGKEKDEGGEDSKYFYRNILKNLAPAVYEKLNEENKLEKELYEYAVELNQRQLDQWKKEVNWNDEYFNTKL